MLRFFYLDLIISFKLNFTILFELNYYLNSILLSNNMPFLSSTGRQSS